LYLKTVRKGRSVALLAIILKLGVHLLQKTLFKALFTFGYSPPPPTHTHSPTPKTNINCS
jgi:hypothetical protein